MPSVDNKADPNRVIVFDTTLRDGEQAPGFSMSVEAKLKMATALRDLGVDVIEAGFAAASPQGSQLIGAEELDYAVKVFRPVLQHQNGKGVTFPFVRKDLLDTALPPHIRARLIASGVIVPGVDTYRVSDFWHDPILAMCTGVAVKFAWLDSRWEKTFELGLSAGARGVRSLWWADVSTRKMRVETGSPKHLGDQLQSFIVRQGQFF